MYARILKFLTNLLFKQVFRGFLTPRKRRKPGVTATCHYCLIRFPAFNKRQHVCGVYWCKRLHRAKQYRARISFADSQRKAIEIAGQSETSVYQTGVVRPESGE